MIRADVHQPFFRKFLYVFLGCTAFAGWCLYDGLIGYPKKLTIAEAYESLPEENRRDAWKELAGENGWPTITPAKTADDVRHDIGSQFMMVVLCMLFGIPALLMFMSGQGTWVEGDQTLIRNSKGQEVPIDAISKIDKRKWEAKGIAKIHYEVDGKKMKFVMDDFKYEREPMGQLMQFAEANLSEEQVTGDFLERDKERIAKQQAAEEESYDDEADYEGEASYEDAADAESKSNS
ncbi:hypothetical protein Mal15_36350 [Stieleria maiorica]|uniref:Uncharacterized protein n=1 Tax=Stieleria maiorica TaxID=2795974 RepID=A0A5B9MHU8_9BACT|nr:hypothetical protein [Stieleria maiorica]QEF99570.1 hypothetical protein Mal15_36350 [Stieleria maiorica]